jgi:hypothetical protein
MQAQPSPPLRPGPATEDHALIALVAEAGVLVVLGGWLVADHVVRRAVRTDRRPRDRVRR